MKKRWLAGMMMAAILVTLLPATALAAEGNVTYLFCDETGANWQTGTKASDEYTLVTADDTTWGADDGQEYWYVVSGNVTIDQRVTITGNVHLILEDDCHLKALKGITVLDKDGDISLSDPDKLAIYAQSTGENMGKLTATGDGMAGIGARSYINSQNQYAEYNSGTIIICGGSITAKGGSYTTGIGGGNAPGDTGAGCGRCNIAIHGGNVTATSGQYCGVALGTAGSTGSVTITGGTVSAGTIGGAFSTGESGGAVLIVNTIRDESGKDGWNCFRYQGNNGTVCGAPTVKVDTALPGDTRLIVASGQAVTVAQGTTFTVSEGVNLINEGAIQSNGTLINNGTINNAGVINGTLDNTNGTIYQSANATLPEGIGGTVITDGQTYGNLLVAGGTLNTDFSYDETTHTLTILSGNSLIITGETTQDSIIVDSGATVTFTLHNLKINLSSANKTASPLIVRGNATITMRGSSELHAKDYVDNNDGYSCHAITVETGGSLTLTGGGSLSATGGHGQDAVSCPHTKGGAGLKNNGTLTIESGRVSLTGGTGGSHHDNGGAGVQGDVTVTGGDVTISGGVGGWEQYGGGSGQGGSAVTGQLTMNGGTVSLCGGNRGGNGNWMGTSEKGGVAAGSVTITGGLLVATGGNDKKAVGGEMTVSGDCLVLTNETTDNSLRTGTVHGSVTWQEGFALGEKDSLTIPAGASLTIAEGTTATVNGTLNAEGTLNINGTLTGSGTITPDSAKLPRPDMTAPSAPTVQSVTADTITLNAIEDAEYGIGGEDDSITWQDGATFSNLTAATEYTFYARYKAEGFYSASNISTGTTQHTAFAAPAEPEKCYTINYIDEIVTAAEGYEVNVNNGTWCSSTNATPRGTLSVRKVAQGDVPAGDAASVTLPLRSAAPEVHGTDTTAAGNDGKFTGVDTTMEYRKDGANTWTICTGAEITGLSAGNYYVRYKATEAAFYSKEATIALREPAAAEGFCLNDGSINVSQDGDKVVVTQNGAQYTIEDGEVRITGNGESTGNTIRVNNVNSATANITLDHVQISSSDYYNNPVYISNSNVTLTLEGDTTMSTSYTGITLNSGTLTIDGPGSLTIGSESQRVSTGIELEGYSGNSSVTVNGGTINIYAQDVGIGGYYGGPITINGGAVRTDVSYGGHSGLGASDRAYGYGSMPVTITGGTVELTGSADKINASSYYPSGGGSVTVTGGSVTVGGINPAPLDENGTSVYAVTVENMGSGTVDAFLLKQGDVVQSYGAPACTDTSGNLVLYLPEGEYTGAAIVDGKLVNFTCEAKVGDTETTNATDTGVTVTTPEGEKPTINDDGTVTLPEGGGVQVGDGPEITLPGGGTVDGGNGSVTVPEGGTVTVKDGSGDTSTITLPSGGGTVTPNEGGVAVPGGSKVQTGDNGPEITLPDGGTVSGNGSVSVPEGGTIQVGDTTVTLPSGGAVKPNTDGTIPLPGGAQVVGKDGETITVPDGGGTYHPDGTVNQDVCTVTFDSQGGSAVAPATVTYGNKVTKPTDPTKEGHTFNGWYHESECTTAFAFDTYVITSDVTLYAAWTENHVHSYGPEWKSDATGHWQECECGEKGNQATHTPGDWIIDQEATSTSAGSKHKECTVCGYVTQTEAIPATGQSSGGSSSPSRYPPTVEQPKEGGTAGVSPSSPTRGDTVTITPKPDSGYEVDKITVTDRNGKPVEVTKNPDGTYSFIQPSGRVKIEVSYKEIETAWSNPFTDVAEGAWYYDAVEYAAEHGLFNGTSDTTFSPNATMTRAMLMTVLARLDGQETEGGDTWYAKGMAWAVAQGISDGTAPDSPITREQLAAMLYRYAKAVKPSGDLSTFADAASVSGWALDAVTWAVENEIIHGKGGGILDPKGEATRAEVATMLMRYCELEK